MAGGCCRQKSGIWGFRSDRVENINGYNTKVSGHYILTTFHSSPFTQSLPPYSRPSLSFIPTHSLLSHPLHSPPPHSTPPPLPLHSTPPSLPPSLLTLLPQVFGASGLDIVTKTRVEHLPEAEKHKHKCANPLQDFLGGGEDGIPALDHAASISGQPPAAEVSNLAPRLSLAEYFRKPQDRKEYDGGQLCLALPECHTNLFFSSSPAAIGRPVEESSRVQKLKATVWLGEGFPLSLQEQIMPIIELMVGYIRTYLCVFHSIL